MDQASNTPQGRPLSEVLFKDEEAEEGVKAILRFVGENPEREGLADTPRRVVNAYEELCQGYTIDPAQVLSTTFDLDDDGQGVTYGGMVVLRDIEFCSLCEHHMLPFVGRVSIAYVPNERVVGISKLARLTEAYARRLQVQERLTAQLAEAIEKHLGALGVLVVVEAEHFCMRMRGVRKQSSVMTTSEIRGVFLDHAARAEALRLIQGGAL